MRTSRRGVVLAAACALGVGLGAAGCGSSASSDADAGSGKTPDATSTTAAKGAIAPAAQAAIDAAYRGTFADPPSRSPTPRRGLNIWFIPFGAELQDWKEPGQIEEAAKALGWDLTTYDGRFSPDNVVTGLRQAIADKADGIVMIVVDCAGVKSGLEAVDTAGIPIVASESIDCDESDPGQKPLFDATAAYSDPENPDVPMRFGDFIKNQWGYTQGLGIISGTGGQARLVDVRETDLASTIYADDGARDALRTLCPECEVVETLEVVGSDLGQPLQQKVSQAFAQHPDANAILSPYDTAVLNVAPAVMASGRADEIWSQAGEGLAPMISLMKKEKGVDGGAGLSIGWEMWACMDALNRLIAGERPTPTGFPSGNGTQLFDREHNLPEGDRWVPPIDYTAAYEKAWGVG